MNNYDLEKLIQENRHCKFPEGFFCSNYCKDCRYMEMDNDFYNDGTRRCAYKGEWLRPSSPACPNFSF